MHKKDKSIYMFDNRIQIERETIGKEDCGICGKKEVLGWNVWDIERDFELTVCCSKKCINVAILKIVKDSLDRHRTMYKYEVKRDLGENDNDITYCEACKRKIFPSRNAWRIEKLSGYDEADNFKSVGAYWLCTKKCVNLYLLQAEV